jgi:signal transduction histidine kinase
VSHELKTPLTSIRGYVETLLSDDLPAEMQRQFLDVVHANAERLHRIVEDLLDLSRLESGGWRPEIRHVDPLAIARDAWLGAAPAAHAKSLTFNAVGDSISALADPAGLRQVLVNLYDNAIRHTPAGGAVTVRVRRGAGAYGDAAQRTEWAVIEVQDSGTGIPGDALGRVFERFYRVDPARSRAEGGTGLGLSIVKHLVERMGGDVAAESELGKGTLVRVRLPLASPTGPTAEHSAA